LVGLAAFATGSPAFELRTNCSAVMWLLRFGCVGFDAREQWLELADCDARL